MEKKWPQVAAFNLFTRNTNIAMVKTQLGLHKSLLRRVKTIGKMAIKENIFQKFREGTGVGKTLTHEGVVKIYKWFRQHCIKGMETTVDNFTSLTPNDSEPECLSWTPGYKGDLMVGFLKQVQLQVRSVSEAAVPKEQGSEDLRPTLASIRRRPSTSASSSSGASRRSSIERRVD